MSRTDKIACLAEIDFLEKKVADLKQKLREYEGDKKRIDSLLNDKKVKKHFVLSLVHSRGQMDLMIEQIQRSKSRQQIKRNIHGTYT